MTDALGAGFGQSVFMVAEVLEALCLRGVIDDETHDELRRQAGL